MSEAPKDAEVLFASEGVQLLRHADGRRELRLNNHALESLESAFDAIVTAIWLAPRER